MTGKSKSNGTLKTIISVMAVTIVLVGMIFGMGVSWASVGRIEDRVNGISEDIDSQDVRVRNVEEAVIRTDERLGYIEDGIDDIKEELRNE